MKLVFLPGMDGTGDLFSPLIQLLPNFDCQIIPLPEVGAQDYSSLTTYVRGCLPEEDFILVAESFSGQIGVVLAMEGIKHMKGIIFVATFLSSPRKLLLFLSKWLPISFLSSLPLSGYFHKVFFLGSSASSKLVGLFQSTVKRLPQNLIKARLNTMLTLKACSEVSDLPVGYIQAASDRLVPSNKVNEFNFCFRNLVIKTIDGPHFILQAKPEESAVVISELANMFIAGDRA